jgi:hypothetical protein
MEETDKSNESSKKDDSRWSSSGKAEEGDYYFNNEGFVVFTAQYLLERGYCCGNGCKNCPYDYKAVPEPKRSKLLEQRKNGNAGK